MSMAYQYGRASEATLMVIVFVVFTSRPPNVTARSSVRPLSQASRNSRRLSRRAEGAERTVVGCRVTRAVHRLSGNGAAGDDDRRIISNEQFCLTNDLPRRASAREM